jgi:hypothetical protein
MAALLASGGDPELPALDPALEFLVEYLFDAGPANAGNVLSWADLEEWQRETGIDLSPWQSRLLRRLSGDYLAEFRAAAEHDAPPPWKARQISETKAAVRALAQL